MLCGALYVVCAKQLSSRCSPVLITTMQSLIGLLFFLCLLPFPRSNFRTVSPLLPTLAILYLGVGVTMLSFLLYNFAVRSVPASRTGAFLNLVPVLTLFIGDGFPRRAVDRRAMGRFRAGVRGRDPQPVENGAVGGKGRFVGNGFPFGRCGIKESVCRSFLSPPEAGALESAILYGADAVYMGGPELSLRTACEGFSGEELGLAVADAHTAGVRVYYCLNAMPYDAQLPAVGSRVGAFARDGRGRPHCR